MCMAGGRAERGCNNNNNNNNNGFGFKVWDYGYGHLLVWVVVVVVAGVVVTAFKGWSRISVSVCEVERGNNDECLRGWFPASA